MDMKLKFALLLPLTLALAGYGLAQNQTDQSRPVAASAPADKTNAPLEQVSPPADKISAPAGKDSAAPAGKDSAAPAGKDSVAPVEQTFTAAKADKRKKDELDFPHDGKIDDVNAIGNRNVGCSKGLGNWYSLEKQVAMGKSFSMQVEQSAKLVTDPVVNEYINRLAQNIVRNSDAKVPFTVKVLDDDTVNAFALPGGYFYVQTGLILAADNEAELAGVMAHEIGHVAACHAARQQTRGNLAQFGDDSADLCRWRPRLRNLRGGRDRRAADIHEVPAQL